MEAVEVKVPETEEKPDPYDVFVTDYPERAPLEAFLPVELPPIRKK